METVYRMATALVRALRSRLFAAAALAVMTAAMVAVVTVNTHAVTVVDGDTSKVVSHPQRGSLLCAENRRRDIG